MNEYTFDDIEIGKSESFSVNVTQEMMDKFLDISGDYNPLHCDEQYAITRGFESRVVYGMLTSSFYSKLAGVYLPGKFCILYGVDSKFNKPVYVGDVLKVSGTVIQKNSTVNMITTKATIINQLDITVSTAIIKASFIY